ncbi:MAG: 30S ribosomal protein S7 [Cyanobacteria bacterium P01_H01_bin.74]
MSRRSKPQKRIPLPDSKYFDPEVTRFICRMMKNGKKSKACRIFYLAIEELEGKTEDPGIEVFRKALKKARPLVRVKARRVGGSTYQVPIEVKEDEGTAIASRWLIQFARKRSGKSMALKLAYEFLDTYKNTGTTIKKKQDTQKMAEANKAFAHFRY